MKHINQRGGVLGIISKLLIITQFDHTHIKEEFILKICVFTKKRSISMSFFQKVLCHQKIQKNIVKNCNFFSSYFLSSWINVFVMLFKEKIWPPNIPFQRDTIICSDGGEISIDWADDEISKKLPKGTITKTYH